MNGRLRGRLLVVSASILAAVSCATTDPYPKDWPAVSAEQRDCSALVGSYNNGYSKSSPDAMAMKGGLIVLLIGPAEKGESSAEKVVGRVTIEHPSPDRLVVKGFSRDELLRRGERRVSRSACSGKGLAINGKFSGTNAENVLGFISASGYLSRAANGDLVGRIRSTFTGIALLVPISSSTTSWYRFKRIESEATPSNSMQ